MRIMTMVALGVAANLATAAPSSAQQSMVLAHSLGELIADEDFCGLTFDQDAIEAFIDAKVAADDMQFTGMMSMFIDGEKAVTQPDMSASQKTAHCRQQARVAKSYGFIK